jgi:hypothetical protein
VITSSTSVMPITYRIDRERGLIFTVCAGEVTLPQVRTHFDALQSDPDCPRRPSVLLDLTRITSLPEIPQVRAAAERVGQLEEIVFEACAILADRDPVVAMARQFEVLARGHFAALRIFRQRKEAEEWLDGF